MRAPLLPSRLRKMAITICGVSALVIALTFGLNGAESRKPALVLTISISAPFQPDSPVHIVGFKHDQRELWFELSNSSGKAVTSVVVGNAFWVPLSCATEEHRETISSGHVRFLVHIGSHGGGVAFSKYVHYPTHFVWDAKSLKAACMMAQMVLDKVYFEDGTTWPAGDLVVASNIPGDPAQPDPEVGIPIDVAGVINGLQSIENVVFDHKETSGPVDDKKGTFPHLQYTCTIEGPKAVCYMPLEGDNSVPPASTGQARP
jgi:hypothetical protein